jgi:hypothetical protein
MDFLVYKPVRETGKFFKNLPEIWRGERDWWTGAAKEGTAAWKKEMEERRKTVVHYSRVIDEELRRRPQYAGKDSWATAWLKEENARVREILEEMEKNAKEGAKKVGDAFQVPLPEKMALDVDIKPPPERKKTWIEMLREEQETSQKIMSDLDLVFGEIDKKYDDLKDKHSETNQDFIRLTERTAERIQDTMGDMFFDWAKGEFDSLGDYIESFWDSMLRIASSYLAQMATEGIFGPLKSANQGGGGEGKGFMDIITGIGTGIGGALGFGGGGGSAPMPTHTALALVKHGGGTVGAGGAMRSMPSEVFVSAPRLHKGMAADEFPAILQRGEEVVPAAEARRDKGPEVQVIINNESGSPAEMREQKGPGGIRQYIVDIGRDAILGGQWDRPMRSTFGVVRQGRLG